MGSLEDTSSILSQWMEPLIFLRTDSFPNNDVSIVSMFLQKGDFAANSGGRF
jgi:hypothetical protein